MAELILKSRNVFTALNDRPEPGAVIIDGKKIAGVVSYGREKDYIQRDTVIIDAGEKLIMPGFIDAHTHFFQGAVTASEYVCTDIENAGSERECAEIIRKFALSHPEYDRIRGFGWFVPKWDTDAFPTRVSLDEAVPDRPVYMVCADTHSMWLNTKALEECSIKADMPLRSGHIGVNEDGSLSGMLIEPDAYAPAMKKFTEFSSLEMKDIYRQFLKKAASVGITAMSEMYAEDYTEEIYDKYRQVKELDEAEGLTLRLSIFTRLFGYCNFDRVFEWKRTLDTGHMRIAGLKGFIDGVVETYTGLLLEPYTDRPDTCGIGVPLEPEESIQLSINEANRAGLPVRLHCIADGSVHMALDIFEKAALVNGKNNFHNTIEHIENIAQEDIGRFRDLNVLPSMQPMHLLLDNNFKKNRIGEERAELEWPIHTILEENGAVALGSDYPVVGIEPMNGIYAAVTRKGFDGSDEGENPWEKITLAQALKGYTLDAARAYGLENDTGSLEAGKYADVVILDNDPFTMNEKELYKVRTAMTVFEGKICYRHNI